MAAVPGAARGGRGGDRRHRRRAHRQPQRADAKHHLRLARGRGDGLGASWRRPDSTSPRLPVAAAFHSGLVKPAQRELAALIEATPWKPVRVPVYSNTTARPHAAEVAQDAQADGRAPGAAGRVRRRDRGDVPGRRARLPRGRAEGDPQPADGQDPGRAPAPGRSRSTTAAAWPACSARSAQLACAGVARRPATAVRASRPAASATRTSSNRCCSTQALPKHAWMLNGSYARRADEPQRQIGVTLEQAGAQQASPPGEAPAAPVEAAPPCRRTGSP